MNSLLIRYTNTTIISCIALVCSLLPLQKAAAQSYTFKNTNPATYPNYDLHGSTRFATTISFINYYPTDGTFNVSGSILCTGDGNNYNGTDDDGDLLAGSLNFIDTSLTGTAYVYINSNCITWFSQTNSYTGGTCIDNATLYLIPGTDATGKIPTMGSLGSTNSKTYLTNGATLDLGGTTQTQQAFIYTPYDPNTAPNGSIIQNGTIIDGNGNSTTFDANGNDVSTPTSGPTPPPMPGSGN